MPSTDTPRSNNDPERTDSHEEDRPSSAGRSSGREAEPASDETGTEPGREKREAFAQTIQAKEERKVEARRRRRPGIIAGMGMFGLVGWSVAIPTLLCLALGIWIDTHVETRFSWTLMLLVVGIFLGSMTAWYWVREESQRPS
jgi:ATP synthase protein I